MMWLPPPPPPVTPTGATEQCVGCSIPDLCPAGSLCTDAYQFEVCPAGYECPAGSHVGVVEEQRCDEVVYTLPLPWCMQRLCEEGSAEPQTCPAGYFCPNATTKLECPEGHYCGAGSAIPTRCTADLGSSAAARCPPGAKEQPRRWLGLVIALLGVWLPLVLLMRVLHKYVEVSQPKRTARRLGNATGLSGLACFLEEAVVVLGKSGIDRLDRACDAGLASARRASSLLLGEVPAEAGLAVLQDQGGDLQRSGAMQRISFDLPRSGTMQSISTNLPRSGTLQSISAGLPRSGTLQSISADLPRSGTLQSISVDARTMQPTDMSEQSGASTGRGAEGGVAAPAAPAALLPKPPGAAPSDPSGASAPPALPEPDGWGGYDDGWGGVSVSAPSVAGGASTSVPAAASKTPPQASLRRSGKGGLTEGLPGRRGHVEGAAPAPAASAPPGAVTCGAASDTGGESGQLASPAGASAAGAGAAHHPSGTRAAAPARLHTVTSGVSADEGSPSLAARDRPGCASNAAPTAAPSEVVVEIVDSAAQDAAAPSASPAGPSHPPANHAPSTADTAPQSDTDGAAAPHGDRDGCSSKSQFETMNDGLGVQRRDAFVRLEWENLDFKIGEAHVLRDLTGHMEHSEMVALMGESGSGKSTLLNILRGQASYGSVTGRLDLNGAPFEPSELKHMVGFVPQAYILFDELTVYENILLAARMRGPACEAAEQQQRRVESVLRLLGLQECRNFVLDKTIGEGRLSGGQTRRVGIGVEVVTEPSILLLDEPTSALDAVNTRIVVNIMKSLTHAGMLVVASIHQPRLSAYLQFDKLLLLSKGRLVYGGACGSSSLRRSRTLPSAHSAQLLASEEAEGAAVRYFGALGYALPARQNPADFFIEICFGFIESQSTDIDALPALWTQEYAAQLAATRRAEARGGAKATKRQFKAWFAAHENHGKLDPKVADAAWRRARRQPLGAAVSKAGSRSVLAWPALVAALESAPMPADNQPGFCYQLRLCLLRVVLKAVRHRTAYVAQLFVAVVLSLVAGLVAGPGPLTDPLYIIITSVLFATFVSTLAISTMAQGAGDELFAHEDAGGVRQTAEVAARMLGDLLLWWPLPILFAGPLWGLINYPGTMGGLVGILLLLWWAMSPLAYVVYVVLPRNATVVVAALALIQGVFLSGQLGPSIADRPGLVAISPSRWAIHAINMDYIVHSPFVETRAVFEAIQIYKGILPGVGANYSDDAQVVGTVVEIAQHEAYGVEAAFKAHMQWCFERGGPSGEADPAEVVEKVLSEAGDGGLPPAAPLGAPPAAPLGQRRARRSRHLSDDLGDEIDLSDDLGDEIDLSDDLGDEIECDDADLAGAASDACLQAAIDNANSHNWYAVCLRALFVIGLLLRLLAMLLFVGRTIDRARLKNAARRWRRLGPAAALRQLLPVRRPADRQTSSVSTADAADPWTPVDAATELTPA